MIDMVLVSGVWTMGLGSGWVLCGIRVQVILVFGLVGGLGERWVLEALDVLVLG